MMLQHRTEIGHAASGESLNWTSTDRIDADVAWSKILCEVTSARFECCFCDAHDVVTGDDFFCAVVRHRNNAAAFGHQRRRSACKLWQRVSTDLECCEKRFASCVEIFAAERFTRREGDAVNQKIEAAKLLADLSKCFVDLFLFRYVAGEQ